MPSQQLCPLSAHKFSFDPHQPPPPKGKKWSYNPQSMLRGSEWTRLDASSRDHRANTCTQREKTMQGREAKNVMGNAKKIGSGMLRGMTFKGKSKAQATRTVHKQKGRNSAFGHGVGGRGTSWGDMSMGRGKTEGKGSLPKGRRPARGTDAVT